MFICFEGVEGIGKSTQANMLTKFLASYLDRQIILTKEPGGTEFGMRVREILKSEPNIDIVSQWHLVEAQRQHHVEIVIKPTLKDNSIIICDRYIWSSYVYQNELYKDTEWRQYLGCKYPVPDITFLLCSHGLEFIKGRITKRDEIADHFDQQTEDEMFHKQLIYKKVYAMFPSKIVLIEADRDEQTIHEEIISIFKEKMRVYENTIHSKA